MVANAASKSDVFTKTEQSPMDYVWGHFKFPAKIERRPYQIEVVDTLGPEEGLGLYMGGGTGKTFVGTCICLYKMEVLGQQLTWVTVPPILIQQWADWLNTIKPKPRVLAYEGTPSQREKFDLTKYDFVISSIQILKKDFAKIYKHAKKTKLNLMVDEAHCIKNPESDNFRKVRDLVDLDTTHFIPMTATPLTTPLDAYAYIKLIAPATYRTYGQFERIHVEKFDIFGKPTKYAELELLRENMRINSVAIQRRDVNTELDAVVYDPIVYDLDKKHLALYRRLVEDGLLPLPDGGKIDATTAVALRQKLQQIVCNYAHFSGDDNNKSTAFELVEQTMDSIGAGKKLVVVGNYRMTNRHLVDLFQHYNAVAAYGEIDAKKQHQNKMRFIEDPTCRIFILQPSSAGFGLDGLQAICSDMLFLEMPMVPKDFHQTVWRLDRDGQQEPVVVRVGIARGTLQGHMLEQLLRKDELVTKIQPSKLDLRREFFGE
jgi:SNF2 family DNA or RNA helicase